MEGKRIDLFKLIDEDEKRSGSWVMAKGKELNDFLKVLINQISLQFGSKRKFCEYLMNKFGFSRPTGERFIWLQKEWHPLFLIKEISFLSGISIFNVQDKIDYLKMNQPPLRVFSAAKELKGDLCKFAGAHAADGTLAKNFVRITDGYESNVIALKGWIQNVFGRNYPVKKVNGSNEWKVEFHSGIIFRYLNKIFDFPIGSKQYIVSEPNIIKSSNLFFRRCYVSGVLMFEAGFGMKHQVELCVSSKDFREAIADILRLSDIKFTSMENKSGNYWRLWSNKLSKEEANKWLGLFEPQTEKWFMLQDYIEGYKGKADNFEDALNKLNLVYPSKSASKVSLGDVLAIIKDLGKTHRYELASLLCKYKNLDSYGGKWAHSVSHYLDILKSANIIIVTKEKFGKKRSFGSVIREVYNFNPVIREWKIPLRSDIKNNSIS